MRSGGGELAAQLRRERLIDMEARLSVYRRRAFVVLGLALIASGPWIGFWFLFPLAAALAFSTLADRLVPTQRHAHRWAAAGWVVSGSMIAVSAALTGEADSPALMWLALPAVTLGARLPRASRSSPLHSEMRGVILGVAYLIGLLLIVTVAIDVESVRARPDAVIFPLALVIATAIFSDAALYAAKRAGRDRVCAAGAEPVAV